MANYHCNALWTIGHTLIPIFGTCDNDFLVTLMRAQVTITLMTCNDGDFVDGDDDKSFVAPSREVRLKSPCTGILASAEEWSLAEAALPSGGSEDVRRP